MADKKLEAFLEEVRVPNVSHEKLMEIYTQWADIYDEIVSAPDYFGLHNIALMVSEVLGDKKEARILDLGAGTGLCAEELVRKGFSNIDALDSNAAMLAIAKKKGIYKNLICDQLGPNRLKIEDSAYDAVTIMGVFIPNHVCGNCLSEIARIIQPGGYFVGAINERFLTSEDLKDSEPAMQRMEDAGVWKRIIRKVELFHAADDGVYFAFQVLPK